MSNVNFQLIDKKKINTTVFNFFLNFFFYNIAD